MSRDNILNDSTVIIKDSENVTVVGDTRVDGRKNNSRKRFESNKVFVSHGHDTDLLNEVVVYFREQGLEPVVSMDLANKGKTIIEKIEATSDVGYAVILYTPCDLGAKNTIDPVLRARARQNVIFEHGYLLAKLGRDRVTTLVKGEIELPSNIIGTLTISVCNQDWRAQLTKEVVAIKKSLWRAWLS